MPRNLLWGGTPFRIQTSGDLKKWQGKVECLQEREKEPDSTKKGNHEKKTVMEYPNIETRPSFGGKTKKDGRWGRRAKGGGRREAWGQLKIL